MRLVMSPILAASPWSLPVGGTANRDAFQRNLCHPQADELPNTGDP